MRDVQNHNLHHDDRRPKDSVRIAASIDHWEEIHTQTPSSYSYWWGNQASCLPNNEHLVHQWTTKYDLLKFNRCEHHGWLYFCVVRVVLGTAQCSYKRILSSLGLCCGRGGNGGSIFENEQSYRNHRHKNWVLDNADIWGQTVLKRMFTNVCSTSNEEYVYAPRHALAPWPGDFGQVGFGRSIIGLPNKPGETFTFFAGTFRRHQQRRMQKTPTFLHHGKGTELKPQAHTKIRAPPPNTEG